MTSQMGAALVLHRGILLGRHPYLHTATSVTQLLELVWLAVEATLEGTAMEVCEVSEAWVAKVGRVWKAVVCESWFLLLQSQVPLLNLELASHIALTPCTSPFRGEHCPAGQCGTQCNGPSDHPTAEVVRFLNVHAHAGVECPRPAFAAQSQGPCRQTERIASLAIRVAD